MVSNYPFSSKKCYLMAQKHPVKDKFIHIHFWWIWISSSDLYAKTELPMKNFAKSSLQPSGMRKSSLFSQYFASIFKISSSFVPNNSHPLLPLLTDFDNSQQTIEKICENLDVHKAKGLDEIRAIVYKRCSRVVSITLNQIFYKLKQNSVFPCKKVVSLM